MFLTSTLTSNTFLSPYKEWREKRALYYRPSFTISNTRERFSRRIRREQRRETRILRTVIRNLTKRGNWILLFSLLGKRGGCKLLSHFLREGPDLKHRRRIKDWTCSENRWNAQSVTHKTTVLTQDKVCTLSLQSRSCSRFQSYFHLGNFFFLT